MRFICFLPIGFNKLLCIAADNKLDMSDMSDISELDIQGMDMLEMDFGGYGNRKNLHMARLIFRTLDKSNQFLFHLQLFDLSCFSPI
jgi:hypothetical protein